MDRTNLDRMPKSDRTTIHRLWKAVLVGIAVIVATACYFWPALLIALGMLLLLLICARIPNRDRDRYIPNLYARDITAYDTEYCAFVRRTLTDLRRLKIRGHPLLWEVSQLEPPCAENSDELLLDLGVWIGWSTRLIFDECQRRVYGFDTFCGLVEDWQLEDQIIKRGTFSLSEPIARRFIRDTGVSIDGGVPTSLGRDVKFIKGSTYDTLAPFLAERPTAPIRLFHMDLDTYESCLHALETCKDNFIVGSILVFDEYLVTNGEMRAFYDFQERYQLEWEYRAWGLEMIEMNVVMVKSRWKRLSYSVAAILLYLFFGDGRYIWAFYAAPFWRFWLNAPKEDIFFMLGAAGSRKSVSIKITGLGKLAPLR
ncbi:methyltransferase [Mycobacterium colombiense]|uniref:TylF/MycF/NovP-related O-methyltransferase n=1 Tax=Mycobacterium colombiense TaxID=339268 RepID=UPI00096C889C|nr:methyltransferase [Mycobacterium colombiense]OMC33785.1 methyltransferase [Mycobacterium colombiense]